jgi:hypothetical protein
MPYGEYNYFDEEDRGPPLALWKCGLLLVLSPVLGVVFGILLTIDEVHEHIKLRKVKRQ